MNTTDALDAAIQHHQAGRLAEAEAVCRQILRCRPTDPEALHRLGLIAHQSRRFETAASLIAQAIAAAPDHPVCHASLGAVLLVLGRAGEAEGALRRHLDRNGDDARVWTQLGEALHEQGK